MKVTIRKHAINSEVQSATSKLRLEVNTTNHIDAENSKEKNSGKNLSFKKDIMANVESEPVECNSTEEDTIDIIDLCSSELERKFIVTERLVNYSHKVMASMLQKRRNSILLIGDSGVGKDTVLKYTAQCIGKGDCPEIFKKQKTAIYQILVEDMQVEIEELIENINSILETAHDMGVKNLAVYVDDIYNTSKEFIMQYESIISNINIELFDNFNFILRFDDCLNEEDQNLYAFMEFFNSHTAVIGIESEDDPISILNLLKYEIADLEQIHQVEMSQKMQELLIILYMGKYYEDTTNYNKILNLFEAVIVTAQLDGEREVSHSTVKRYFSTDFENMEHLSKESIRMTAVHEAGHILVAILNPKIFIFGGISILHDSETKIGGMTCVKMNKIMDYSEKDIITCATMDIAGRVAELVLSGEKLYYNYYRVLNANSGAVSDLHNMNHTLRNWVMHLGVYKDIGFNMYYDKYEELPEKTKRKVNRIVNKMAKRAFKKAMATIKANKTFIIEVTELLLENYTATSEDIRKIAKKTIKDF